MDLPIRKDLAYFIAKLQEGDTEADQLDHLQQIIALLQEETYGLQQLYLSLEEISQTVDKWVYAIHGSLLQSRTSVLEKKNAAVKIDELQQAYAALYIKIIQDNETMNFKSMLSSETIACVMHAALHHLCQIQMWHYQLNYPVPEKLWSHIHFIYLEACEYKVSNHKALLKTILGDSYLTIEERYKRALLLGTTNAAYLDYKEMEALYFLLESWVKYAEVYRRINRASLYGIFLYGDSPPMYQSVVSKAIKDPDKWCSLDTMDLFEMLQNKYKSAVDKKEAVITFDEIAVDTKQLSRIFYAWGNIIHRKFERLSEKILVEAKFNVGAFGKEVNNSQTISLDFSAITEWETRNVSATGYGLLKRWIPDIPVHAGQLIQIRETNHSQHWNLAVIRWIQNVGEQGGCETLLGVELLAPACEFVEFSNGQINGHAILALFTRKGKQMPTIIMPTSVSITGSYRIKEFNQSKEYLIRFTESCDRDKDYVRYFYEVIDF